MHRDKEEALTPKQRVKFVINFIILLALFFGMFILFSPIGIGKYKYDYNSDKKINSDDIAVIKQNIGNSLKVYVNSEILKIKDTDADMEKAKKQIEINWKKKNARYDLDKDREITENDVKLFKEYLEK